MGLGLTYWLRVLLILLSEKVSLTYNENLFQLQFIYIKIYRSVCCSFHGAQSINANRIEALCHLTLPRLLPHLVAWLRLEWFQSPRMQSPAQRYWPACRRIGHKRCIWTHPGTLHSPYPWSMIFFLCFFLIEIDSTLSAERESRDQGYKYRDELNT